MGVCVICLVSCDAIIAVKQVSSSANHYHHGHFHSVPVACRRLPQITGLCALFRPGCAVSRRPRNRLRIAFRGAKVLPFGMLAAITGGTTPLSVIAELILGFMLPGRPIALMLFKTYTDMLTGAGIGYVADMKVGHYLQVPPWSVFAAQFFAVIWLSPVQGATYRFLTNEIPAFAPASSRKLSPVPAPAAASHRQRFSRLPRA